MNRVTVETITALRESEERYRLLFEGITDAVFVHGMTDDNMPEQYLAVNDVACERLGYTREELLRLSPQDIDAPESTVDVRSISARVRKDGGALFEQTHVTKDGRRIPVEINARRFHVQGRIMVLSVARDVTERKQAEEAIRQLNETLEKRVAERTRQLELANKELKVFAYSVSHDLRAPLRSIDGFSRALLEDYTDRLDPEGRDYLQRVRRASQHMGNLIDGLLRISRLTSSELVISRINLSAMAGEIVAGLKGAEPARNVAVTIAPDLVANADAHLMRVVLENLFANAWKFTSKCAKATIEFGSAVEGEDTVYHVRDNGAGFEMKSADRLFGVFQRLHAASDYPGDGIGLASAQRIIHRHGGRIWAESKLGEGAVFYFTLLPTGWTSEWQSPGALI